jgi:hypothetical protein
MNVVDSPDEGTPEYDWWLFHRAWEAARREERKRTLEECVKIGTDFLSQEMPDRDYWMGGRGQREGVALYTKCVRNLLAALEKEKGDSK